MSPHLIIEHEKVVIKCQYDPEDQQILIRDLVLDAVHNIAAEHTFVVVLITEITARVLSASQ